MLQKDIWAWIEAHEEEMAEDILSLVRIKSVSSPGADGLPFGQGCKDALDAMLAMGARYGFSTRNYEDEIGCIDMGREGAEIAFWGHLDVVPEGSDWDFPPYEGVRKGNLLIGRGAQDNKGQTVAVLYVMRCIAELNIPLRHNLRLYVGTNEEDGMEDIARYLENHAAPVFSIIADSDFPVCYGEKGILTLEFTAPWPDAEPVTGLWGGSAPNMVPHHAEAALREGVKMPESTLAVDNNRLIAAGTAGHTAFPENSVNAITRLTQALAASGLLSPAARRLMDFCNLLGADCYGEAVGAACQDEASGKMTLVGSMISTEQGVLRLTVNIRYPVTAKGEEISAVLAAAAKEYGFSMETSRHSPAHLFPLEHPIVATLTDVYNRYMGVDRKPFVLPGGTYARMLPNAISYGMGFGKDAAPMMGEARQLLREGHGGAHGPDEIALLEGLKKGIAIYLQGLMAIDSMDIEKTLLEGASPRG